MEQCRLCISSIPLINKIQKINIRYWPLCKYEWSRVRGKGHVFIQWRLSRTSREPADNDAIGVMDPDHTRRASTSSAKSFHATCTVLRFYSLNTHQVIKEIHNMGGDEEEETRITAIKSNHTAVVVVSEGKSVYDVYNVRVANLGMCRDALGALVLHYMYCRARHLTPYPRQLQTSIMILSMALYLHWVHASWPMQLILPC